MRPLAVLLIAFTAAACAERQDSRSQAEASCAAQAERLVLERNRGRTLQLDSSISGPATLMEETNVSTAFARQGEFRDRDRLTRECLQRTNEAQNQPGAARAAANPASAPATAPAPAPAVLAPAPSSAPASGGELRRGTALPPPPAELPPPQPGATPPVRGW